MKQLGAVLLFTGLTIAGAKVSVQIWQVPFTLQTIAVYSSGLFLGWFYGGISQVLYICIGMLLPVFAAEGSGAGYIFGRVTSGYLLSFPLVATLIGWLSRRWPTLPGTFAAVLCGSVLLFSCGVSWMVLSSDQLGWVEGIYRGWLRMAPVDLLKILIVTGLYQVLNEVWHE